jgi:hypothetical protein
LKTIDNIDVAISNEQEKLAKYQIEMQTVRQSFMKATIVFFTNWYESSARHYVTSESQNTISLGKEKLVELKVKLKDITDNAEKYVNEFLSADSLWWQSSLKDGDNFVSPYSQYGSKCPEIIDHPIRKGLGKLGVLLEEYGYNVATKAGSYDDEVSVWNNKNVSPYPSNPVPYFPDSLEWSSDMKVLMKRYDELCKQAHEAISNIKRFEQSKIDKLAADLWDSV